MKQKGPYLILNKARLMLMISVLLLIIFLVISFTCLGRAKQVSSTKKVLPVYCTEQSEKIVSITFDAAWGADDTKELIDIMAKYDAHATVFVVGDWVTKYPEAVKAFHDAGHEIGNHSDTHPYMSNLSRDDIKKQIEGCNAKIEAVTGQKPKVVRAPYGDYNNAVVEGCRQLGMECIQWDVDSLDWKGLSIDEISGRVVKTVKPGSIVLFHNDVANTPAALQKTLEQLKQDGYRFVPVSELLHKGETTIDNNGMQHPVNPPSSLPENSGEG